jgi:hydroxymethylbilane synthase
VPARGDPRDALVGCTLRGLAPGAAVATGSVRRRAQLAWLRPDLSFAGVRGNIATRLDKVPPGGAVVVAAVALARLDLSERAAEILPTSVMLPQVGQGAIAVECRVDDERTVSLLAEVDRPSDHLAVACERAFLARLGSGCNLPVGARATIQGGAVEVEGLLASLDGRVVLRRRLSGAVETAEPLGRQLAEELLGSGGSALIDAAGAATCGTPAPETGGTPAPETGGTPAPATGGTPAPGAR